MKISKKILAIFMCGLIAVGGSQVSTLVKADAATVTNGVAQKGERWRLGIRLKLRAKHNMFYKAWRQVDLVCYNDGSLKLDKVSTIPGNLTFDDTFYIGFRDMDYPGAPAGQYRVPFTLNMNEGGNTDALLRKEVADFNNAGAKVGDNIFANGKGWNDTLKFSSVDYPVKQFTENDYTHGYSSIGRWNAEFKAHKTYLEEVLVGRSSIVSEYQQY